MAVFCWSFHVLLYAWLNITLGPIKSPRSLKIPFPPPVCRSEHTGERCMNEGVHRETRMCLGSGQGQDLKAVIRFPDSTLEATIWVVFWGKWVTFYSVVQLTLLACHTSYHIHWVYNCPFLNCSIRHNIKTRAKTTTINPHNFHLKEDKRVYFRAKLDWLWEHRFGSPQIPCANMEGVSWSFILFRRKNQGKYKMHWWVHQRGGHSKMGKLFYGP